MSSSTDYSDLGFSSSTTSSDTEDIIQSAAPPQPTPIQPSPMTILPSVLISTMQVPLPKPTQQPYRPTFFPTPIIPTPTIPTPIIPTPIIQHQQPVPNQQRKKSNESSFEMISITDSDDEPQQSCRSTRRKRHDDDDFDPNVKKPAKKVKKTRNANKISVQREFLQKILDQNAEILKLVGEFRQEAKDVFMRLNLKK